MDQASTDRTPEPRVCRVALDGVNPKGLVGAGWVPPVLLFCSILAVWCYGFGPKLYTRLSQCGPGAVELRQSGRCGARRHATLVTGAPLGGRPPQSRSN